MQSSHRVDITQNPAPSLTKGHKKDGEQQAVER